MTRREESSTPKASAAEWTRGSRRRSHRHPDPGPRRGRGVSRSRVSATASRAASAFAEDMELDARWTRRAVARLQGHAEKMTKLDEGAARARVRVVGFPEKTCSTARGGGDGAFVGGEDRRRAESRARARSSFWTCWRRSRRSRRRRRRGAPSPRARRDELESTRADLEEKRAALRLAADRDAEVSGDADAALTSLRAAILKVMTAVVGDRGEGASAAKREPEPSRAKTLQPLQGSVPEAAAAATSGDRGRKRRNPLGVDIAARARGRRASELGGRRRRR